MAQFMQGSTPSASSKWDQRGPADSSASGSKWDVGGPGSAGPQAGRPNLPSRPPVAASSWRPGMPRPASMSSGVGFAAAAPRVPFPQRRGPVVMAPPKPPSSVAYMGKGGPAVPLVYGHMGRGGSMPVMAGRPGIQIPTRSGAAVSAPGTNAAISSGSFLAQYQAQFGMPKQRSLSPHAGSRAMRTMMAPGQQGEAAPQAGVRSRSRSASNARKRKRSESSKSSDSSSVSSSSSSRKKKKKKKKRTRTPSSDAGDGYKSGDKDAQAEVEEPKEVQEAKLEALQKLTALQSVDPKERIKGYRALLREWHPDKNPDRLEVATAVFQFLQKGKRLLNLDSA